MARKDQKRGTHPSTGWETPPPDFCFILFERVEPEENANRFYFLGWMPTLLHPQAVVRMYGRKGETQHAITPQPFDSLEAAWPLLRSIIKARLRCGYHVVMPETYRQRRN